ncbi:D-xylose 1-dehydrogenase Gfo6 (plasmid) [Haloferacaceae archaeon DSL9]
MPIEDHLGTFAARDWQTATDVGSIRLAVVGLGDFGCTRAIPAMIESDLCEPTVAVSRTPEKARSVAADFEMSAAISDAEFHAGTATESYDAVYISTPNAYHLEYAESAAAHGKHVLCEKPLEVSVERAERIVNSCADAGVTLMIGYRMQAEPVVRRTRELIADGFVGEPTQLHGRFSNRIHADADRPDWRLNPEVSGGGALIDLGIYPLNTMRFLLDADPIAVYGSTTSQHDVFAEVDEHVAFHLSFPEQISASCTASFNTYPSSRLEISGTDGEIHISSAFGGVVPHEIVAEREEMRTEYTGPPVDEVIEEFDYFAHCVLTGMEPEPDGRDGVADLEAIRAIYESAETGRRITL